VTELTSVFNPKTRRAHQLINLVRRESVPQAGLNLWTAATRRRLGPDPCVGVKSAVLSAHSKIIASRSLAHRNRPPSGKISGSLPSRRFSGRICHNEKY